MKERILYIDKLKGIAMLAVVMGHLSLTSFQIDNGFTVLLVSTFHMPLFMFLSGFVLTSLPSLPKLGVKLCRLLCPMLFIGMLFSLSFTGSAWSFIFDGMKKGYWYLLVLSVFSVLLLLFKLNRSTLERTRKWGDLLITALIYGILILLSFIFSPTVADLLSLHLCAIYWPFFIGGFFIRKYQLQDYLLKNNSIFSISLLLYALSVIIYLSGHYGIHCIGGLFAIPVFVYLFHETNTNRLIDVELMRMGRHSLDIYLFHFFFVKVLFLGSLGQWIAETHNSLVEFCLALLIAICIGYICIGLASILHKSHLIENIVFGKAVTYFINPRTER